MTRRSRPAAGRGGLARPVALVGALLLMVGLAACGGGRPGPDGGGGATITWYAGSIDQRQNDFRQILVDAFEESHPDITVNVTFGPVDTDVNRAEIADAVRSGHGAPDVYLGDVVWPAQFARDGLALPLDKVLGTDFWRRFDPAALASARYRGRLYAAPLFTDRAVLFYRTDLVRQPPTTWEQLAEEARALHASGAAADGFVWQGAPYEGLTCVWTELLADAGGSVVNRAGTASTVDSPAGVKALRFLRGLVTSGATPAGVTGFQETDADQLFASGQAAFLRSWNPTYGRLTAPGSAVSDQVAGHVGIAPLPTFAGRPGPGFSTVGGWSLYVNPHTRNLGAVSTFIRWMTDQQAQGLLVRLAQLPTNAAVRADPAVRANPLMATGLAARPVTRPAATPAYPKLSRAVYTNVSAAIGGGTTVPAALRASGTQIDQALRD